MTHNEIPLSGDDAEYFAYVFAKASMRLRYAQEYIESFDDQSAGPAQESDEIEVIDVVPATETSSTDEAVQESVRHWSLHGLEQMNQAMQAAAHAMSYVNFFGTTSVQNRRAELETMYQVRMAEMMATSEPVIQVQHIDGRTVYQYRDRTYRSRRVAESTRNRYLSELVWNEVLSHDAGISSNQESDLALPPNRANRRRLEAEYRRNQQAERNRPQALWEDISEALDVHNQALTGHIDQVYSDGESSTVGTQDVSPDPNSDITRTPEHQDREGGEDREEDNSGNQDHSSWYAWHVPEPRHGQTHALADAVVNVRVNTSDLQDALQRIQEFSDQLDRRQSSSDYDNESMAELLAISHMIFRQHPYVQEMYGEGRGYQSTRSLVGWLLGYIAYLQDSVQDFADHGIRADLHPTMVVPWDNQRWLNHLSSIDQNNRLRARSVLDGHGSMAVQGRIRDYAAGITEEADEWIRNQRAREQANRNSSERTP